jgi:hypothetical protein
MLQAWYHYGLNAGYIRSSLYLYHILGGTVGASVALQASTSTKHMPCILRYHCDAVAPPCKTQGIATVSLRNLTMKEGEI